MEPQNSPKDAAFLSRPRQGEAFEIYKKRMINSFKEKGWLSPEDGEEPSPPTPTAQPPREGQTED